jgi:hypothetical protein
MKTAFRLSLLFALIAAMLIVVAASAQTGGGYDLAWNTWDGGGGASSGGGYEVNGTLGQFDAGVMTGSAGGQTYALSGGFWVDFQPYRLYLPLILKG